MLRGVEESENFSRLRGPAFEEFAQDNLAKSEQNPIRPLTGSMITRALPPIPSRTPWGRQTLHPEQMTEKKRVGKSRLSASQRTGLRGGSVFSLHKHINHN